MAQPLYWFYRHFSPNNSNYIKTVFHKKMPFGVFITIKKNSNILKEHGVINLSVNYLSLYNFKWA